MATGTHHMAPSVSFAYIKKKKTRKNEPLVFSIISLLIFFVLKVKDGKRHPRIAGSQEVWQPRKKLEMRTKEPQKSEKIRRVLRLGCKLSMTQAQVFFVVA